MYMYWEAKEKGLCEKPKRKSTVTLLLIYHVYHFSICEVVCTVLHIWLFLLELLNDQRSSSSFWIEIPGGLALWELSQENSKFNSLAEPLPQHDSYVSSLTVNYNKTRAVSGGQDKKWVHVFVILLQAIFI